MSQPLLATFVAFALSPVAVAADEPAAPTDPLAAIVAAAAHRPVVIALETVWSVPCQKLDRLLEAVKEPVVVRVDAERGDGRLISERLQPAQLPSLVVLDGKGKEQARREGFAPDLTAWLGKIMTLVALGDDELAKDGDPWALQMLAERARARGDRTAERAWLGKVVASDGNVELRERAAQRLLAAELAPKLVEMLRTPVLAHAKTHAGVSGSSLLLLHQLGVDGATLDRELMPLVATMDPTRLGNLARQALAAGALDTALAAANRAATFSPSLETLGLVAEAHHARGETAEAIAAQRRALALPKLERQQKAELERQLARFGRADRRELAAWASSANDEMPFGFVGLGARPGLSAVADAEAAARRLIVAQAGRVGAACQTLAPSGLDDVYVRVTLAEGAARPARIEVLEPRATAGFRVCTERVLRATVVPPHSPATMVVAPLSLCARP